MDIAKVCRFMVATTAILMVTGCLSLVANGTAAAEPNPDDYYPPIIQRLSERQVETMKSNLERSGNACDLIPLPYLAGLACRNDKGLEDVVNKAYYRDKGLIGKFYIHKRVTSLNYYEWQVDESSPAGRVGSGLPADLPYR